MSFEVKKLADFSSPRSIWNKIVDNTQYAWFWSTYQMYLFRLSVLNTSNRLVADKSFILLIDDIPCGLAPLTFIKAVDFEGIQASYDDHAPLPWPMVADHVADRVTAIDFMIDELERCIKDAGTEMLSLMLSPPGSGGNYPEWFKGIVRKKGFIDSSFASHYLDITPTTLESVRKRYRRYVKKFWDKYELSVLDHDDCYPNLAKEYMDLHVKDSGGVYRSIETYEAQIDFVRNGEGFMIQARNKSDDKVAGMLIISCFKNSAYDNSVAVDPGYQYEYISHLMKWRVIQHLQQLGIEHYELGAAAISPSYLWQPSSKNYGISHFKEGWSRNHIKQTWVAEKYYSTTALEAMWRKKLDYLKNYFSV